MNEDPIAAALRRDAALLLERAPAPNAAAVWHAVRRERARRVRLIIDICGWGLRAAIAGIFILVAVAEPDALAKLGGPLVLIGWLSRGMCSPIRLRAAAR
jgi:hypothetical protein